MGIAMPLLIRLGRQQGTVLVGGSAPISLWKIGEIDIDIPPQAPISLWKIGEIYFYIPPQAPPLRKEGM